MNITILDDYFRHAARDGVLTVEVYEAGRAGSSRCARRAIRAPRITPDLP